MSGVRFVGSKERKYQTYSVPVAREGVESGNHVEFRELLFQFFHNVSNLNAGEYIQAGPN